MLRGPVADDETLETKFVLEDVVLEVGVLASVAVVDLVVSAHDRASAGADSIGERPCVKLVLMIISGILKYCLISTYQSDIVNVRGDGLADVGSTLAEVFLLIADVVLGASNDTSLLNTLDGLVHTNT